MNLGTASHSQSLRSYRKAEPSSSLGIGLPPTRECVCRYTSQQCLVTPPYKRHRQRLSKASLSQRMRSGNQIILHIHGTRCENPTFATPRIVVVTQCQVLDKSLLSSPQLLHPYCPSRCAWKMTSAEYFCPCVPDLQSVALPTTGGMRTSRW